MGKRRRIQLLSMQPPMRQVLVKDRDEAVVMVPLDDIREFVYDKILQARRRLLAEAAWAMFVVIGGFALWPTTRALLLYAGLVYSGVWVFPLLTVHLPHRNYGDTPFTQTHTLRGHIIPALFLELTHHLEHHLYPQIPSHNLARLSRRLDPIFREAGVMPRRVP